MIRYELIICFTNNTWTTAFVDVCPEHIDSDDDVHQSYIEKYMKNWKPGVSYHIAFVGTYNTEDMDNVPIGWQPAQEEFPVAGLTVLEVYENLEHGKSCHPEVKKWVEAPDSSMVTYTIIPYDGKN